MSASRPPRIAFANAAFVLDDPRGDARLEWACGLAADEDRAISATLEAAGATVVRAAWTDPAVDWSGFDLVVLRGVWDYIERIDGFFAWLAQPALAGRLVNGLAQVRENLDKHYLGTLAAAGLPVVPTRFVARGAGIDLAAECAAAGWEEVVVKPAISNGGAHTYRLARGDRSRDAVLQEVNAVQALLVQPFLPVILGDGERSIVVIDGVATHALVKRARAGEFRVQGIHGGSVEPYVPDAAERAFAERVVAACAERPAYARVDFVRGPDGPLLMELELIEPDLFLRLQPDAGVRLAHAILDRLGRLGRLAR